MSAPAAGRVAEPTAPSPSRPRFSWPRLGRPWFTDVDAAFAAAPIVVLIVVGALRKGAFFKPDVVVLPALCVALALVSPPVLRWLAAHPWQALAGAGVTAWWLADAIAGAHPVESWRMPATWICAACGYGVVRSLSPLARRLAALAVTVIGCLLSIVGVLLVAARATSTTWTWADERSLRFAGPLTYPSAIGLFLVLALLASTDAWRADAESDARIATAARSLLLLGVVATDSRGALLALLVLLCFRSVRQAVMPSVAATAAASPLLLLGQRDGVRPWLILLALALAIALSLTRHSLLRRGIRVLTAPALAAAAWLLATQHHAVSGVDASWTERGHILHGAWNMFAADPLLGAGPDPWIPTTTLTGVPGVDAFAHNEPVQVLISIGLVGTAAFAVAAAFVVRALWPRRSVIATPALAVAAAAGLVDFVWHFAALGLLAGVVAGVGRSAASAAGSEGSAGSEG